MNFKTSFSLVFVALLIAGGVALYRSLPTLPSSGGATITTPRPAPTPTPPVARIPDQRAPLERPSRSLPDMLGPPLPPNSVANRLLIEKKARRLTLFYNDKLLKTYEVSLGRQPEGPKQFEGDNKTPEGHYQIDSRKKNSTYHRALHISYPNAKDLAFATRQKRPAGGSIMIHGLPNGLDALGPLHLRRDWTAGCIAVTNSEIEEIWRVTPDGTPIEIRP